jgi:hypothetical protein
VVGLTAGRPLFVVLRNPSSCLPAASHPRKHSQRRRCVRIARLTSSQKCDVPLLAKRGLWCRERNEVSGSLRNSTMHILLTVTRYKASECNTASRPTATCPQATSPTSRLAIGLEQCTAVRVCGP